MMQLKFLTDVDTSGDDSGEPDNTLAYIVLGAVALFAIPYLTGGKVTLSAAPSKRKLVSKGRAPRAKLIRGVRAKHDTYLLSKQPDGSYA
ncbi:MAG: hypothetical protein ACRD33_00155 [Candidatus Acidiferrales bacterium]